MKNKKGFTLIELMTTIVILGLIIILEKHQAIKKSLWAMQLIIKYF